MRRRRARHHEEVDRIARELDRVRAAFDGHGAMTAGEALGALADAAQLARAAGLEVRARSVLLSARPPESTQLDGVPWRDMLDAGLAEVTDRTRW